MQFPKKERYLAESASQFDNVPLSEYCDAAFWFRDLAERARAEFKTQGIPNPKLERWKYTSLAQTVKNFKTKPTGSHMAFECDPDYVSAHELSHTGLRKILETIPSQTEKYNDMALWHLNTAFMTSVVVIDIPDGVEVKTPFMLGLGAEEDDFINDRFVVRLGKNAKARFVELNEGDGQYWRNNVCQIILDDGAHLQHIRLLQDTDKAVSTNNIQIELAANAHYDGFLFNRGAKLSRQQVHADIKGTNSRCDINAIHLLGGSNHADATFEVAHYAQNCQSNQLVRSVIDDQATGVFQGKVYVDQKAQKTDGYQLSNTLILSEGAEMNTKPELEIYADDVKCSHGATTGQIDENMLFYLRSRGLSEAQAKSILIEAFVAQAVDNLGDEDVKEHVLQKVRDYLDKSR